MDAALASGDAPSGRRKVDEDVVAQGSGLSSVPAAREHAVVNEATHATVATFRMDMSRGDLQRQGLHDHIVPRVRRHPGFVSGTWMLDREAATSLAVITFASREAAESFQDNVRANATNQAAAGVELVDIRLVEVEASAS